MEGGEGQEPIEPPLHLPLFFVSHVISSSQDIECIQHAAIRLCQVPLCLPRSFFQLLQSTNIKVRY